MTTGPLSGVKVLEIAGIGPGPFCGMLLADLGADVVRVDRPGGGGMQLVPWADDLLNRGKRSIAVDLAKPGGAETVLSLVEHADILFEGFRPGVAERLGIGPEPCLLRRPQLIYGRMTGWGQDGPIAHTAGHDITYIATTGALHAIGQAGGPRRSRSTSSATSPAEVYTCWSACWPPSTRPDEAAVAKWSTLRSSMAPRI